MTKGRINNTTFRQKLDPISENNMRKQNPLELVFEDISTFDTENPIVASLLQELDVGKKGCSKRTCKKKAPRPPGINFTIRKRLNKLKNRAEPIDDDNNNNNNNNNNNLSPPPCPPPQPPPSFSQRPQIPQAPPFVSPPSGRFLELFQRPQQQQPQPSP